MDKPRHREVSEGLSGELTEPSQEQMIPVLADTFTASLARLNNEEQKQAKLTVFDLQLNPDQPGLQFHRVDKAISPDI